MDLSCAGIYKNDGPFDVMIDISKVKQLHTIPSATEVCYLNQNIPRLLVSPFEKTMHEPTELARVFSFHFLKDIVWASNAVHYVLYVVIGTQWWCCYWCWCSTKYTYKGAWWTRKSCLWLQSVGWSCAKGKKSLKKFAGTNMAKFNFFKKMWNLNLSLLCLLADK